MRNILHPGWLFLTNTIPIAIMAAIYYGNFTVIESLLDPESVSLWITFGIALAIIWLAGLGYAAFCITYRRRISVFYCIAVLSVFIPFLYTYAMCLDDLIPRNIPMWMMPEDITMYAGTFLMPAMAHALFSLVIVFTRKAHERKPLPSLLVTLVFPVAWFLFYQLVLPFWRSTIDYGFAQHVLITLFIASSVVFLFALVRAVYIISARRDKWGLRWVWRVLIGCVLPITGLTVNLGFGFFGDFSHPIFFILATITGLTLLLPEDDNKRYRLFLFIARSITFTFTLYFFAVFLPYLPLSILAIMALLTGFLMLAPLALMVVHCRALYADIGFLKKYYPSRFIYGLLIAGSATLPLGITWFYLHDKSTLNHALNHVYSPDYQQQGTHDAESLQRVLNTVRDYKSDMRFDSRQIPFLSSYYNWLVLDHLTMSETKINTLERIFNDAPLDTLRTFADAPINSESVHVSAVNSTSQYDAKQQAWRSTVLLSITNATDMQSEFAGTFTLPAGCWIDGYALWIGNEKTPGILAEKKTATWIYQQITRYRRDPGILYYLTGNRVALRIFPFEAKETRKTSFTLLHKEPVRFTLDNREITLGKDTPGARPGIEYAGQAVYIPAQIKQSMPAVKRQPYPFFILDCSEHTRESRDRFIADIESYFKRHAIDPEAATFVLTNAYTLRVEGLEAAKNALHDYSFSGGFFLERALKQIAVSAFAQQPVDYPHIIVLTPDMERAILTEDLADLQWALPDSDFFYELSSQGDLLPHHLNDHPLEVYTGTMPALPYPVAAWPDAAHAKAYVRLDTAASVIPGAPADAHAAPPVLQAHNWYSALALEGAWMTHLLHPERTGKSWLELVRGSFQAQVMTPVTSFLAVENEAQRKVLLKKQKDVLNANPNLDVGEETRMSEPGLMLTTLLLLATLLALYRKSFSKRFNTQLSVLQKNL